MKSPTSHGRTWPGALLIGTLATTGACYRPRVGGSDAGTASEGALSATDSTDSTDSTATGSSGNPSISGTTELADSSDDTQTDGTGTCPVGIFGEAWFGDACFG